MNSSAKVADDAYFRVKKLSRWLKALASLGMIISLGFGLSVIAVPEWFDNMVRLSYPDLPFATYISWFKRGLLIILFSLPLAVTLYGLWNVRLLFDCYARGRVFSEIPARYIRNVGLAMVVNVITSIFVHSIGSVLLTFDNPTGNRQFTVTLSSNMYLLVLMGGLLIVIGWVMQEASRISDENRQFV